MLRVPDIRLALPHDARGIAEMSRDYIEHGLAWSWTPNRVRRSIRDPATNVAVIAPQGRVLAFGIMQYGDDHAHLSLLAVDPTKRHTHLGAWLLAWLEQAARVAGTQAIHVEARSDNASAIAFYQRQGFTPSGRIPDYYAPALDALRLEKKLRDAAGA